MLFNSLTYAIFLPIVFILYWKIFKNNRNGQNILLLIASYVFYGWWDYRFLSLIFISSCVDFLVGVFLGKTEKLSKRKLLLSLSIITNLGLLGFFKYFNFFTDSFADLLTSLGLQANYSSLNIILPVGISFYTFQTLSYTLDVYKKELLPTRDFVSFFAFVSFFPQLVAGPIERASNLLPQFYKKRNFDLEKAKGGLRQILWGLFKKIVIADTCATQVEYIFSNYNNLSGITLIVGVIYFAFQIYGDFSGYSDIAIGSARLFGFDLMRNFAYPYFSRNIAEFWRRWHISLSTWFRDYVYIPLGGNRGNKFNQIKNSIITFTISGFWHGANWTFVIWGFLNGLYYIPGILFGNIKKKKEKNKDIVALNRIFPSFREISAIIITFILTLIAWVFFRAQSVSQAFYYIRQIAVLSFDKSESGLYSYLYLILILVIIEWINRRHEHPLYFKSAPAPIRWIVYYAVLMVIFLYFKDAKSFIYFQF
ncbi:MAG: MBOAT family O-acyltransferase [Bacteroidales bacterium]